MEIIIINKTKMKIEKEKIKRFIYKLSKELKFKGDLSVLFCGDLYCKKINYKFLKRRGNTDVISFTINENNYLGDLLVNLRQVKRQSLSYKIPFKEELGRILIHGILHLLGYDHERDNGEMLKLQEELNSKFKL